MKEQLENYINDINNPNIQKKSPYDDPITKDEIMKAVKTLKNGKSTSSDLISNEMLKYGIHQLKEPLLKLFNIIFKEVFFSKTMEHKLHFFDTQKRR